MADLFRSLTESLDQGLVLLDPGGTVLSINPRAARVLDPRIDVIYETERHARNAYPLGAAVQTLKRQRGVRGHRDDAGAVTWMSVDGRPLRRPDTGEVYGFVGILSDVSAEKDWELERLRPAGELSPSRPVPLDLVRIVNEIPHLFPEQFVSEARRPQVARWRCMWWTSMAPTFCGWRARRSSRSASRLRWRWGRSSRRMGCRT